MTKSASPASESARLAALSEYGILDTGPEAAFDDLALLASQVLETPIALISFIDSSRQWFKAGVGLSIASVPRDVSFCNHTIIQDGLLIVPDALADDRFAANPLVVGEPKIRFYAGAPLVGSSGHRIGTLCAIDLGPRQIDERQQAALRALARQVVALLDLRRALGELSRSYQQVHRMAEMSRMLQSCLGSEETHGVIADFGRQIFPEEDGRVFLRNRASGNLEAAAAWGNLPGGEILEVNDCWALRRGEPYTMLAAAGAGPVCPHLQALPLEYSLCVPLIAQGETIGALSLARQAGPERRPVWSAGLTESKRSMIVAMAQTIALALGNLRLRETLESQSLRDPLTGLFNRRYLEESLDRELAHSARHRRPLGLVMIDLDRFKRYNDRFGHPAGDELLRAVGDLLKRGVRAGDIACRYGGDEFVLILPGAGLEVTRGRAEELRETVKQFRMIYRQQPVEPVTLSTGVAAFPEHGSAAKDLLHAADAALYRAKAQGRDCAVVALASHRRE